MFLSIFIISFTLFATAKKPLIDLTAYTFEEFVLDFRFPWSQGSTEWNYRKELFTAELQRVLEHNNMLGSWKEGINKFSAMTPQEKKVYCQRIYHLFFLFITYHSRRSEDVQRQLQGVTSLFMESQCLST